MRNLLLLSICLIMIGYAADWAPASIPASEVHREILPAPLYFEAECYYTGSTSTPPWQIYGRDAPWSTDVQVPDVYSRDDKLLSMAEGPDGKIYVAYDAIASASPLRYGTGIAWSVDNGATWNNMVYYSSTNSICHNEITVTDDGKIWIWGSLTGGTYISIPVFLFICKRLFYCPWNTHIKT